MKKTLVSAVVAAIALTSSFAATTIKMGYTTVADDPRGIASKLFKDEVEKATKGSVKVELYDKSTLGNIGLKASDSDLIEEVINKGKIDMTVSSAGNFDMYAPGVGVSALPFLFADFNKAWKFMDSPIVAGVNKKLEASNIVVLGHYDNGFRCVTTSNKAVNSVADMKGLKIRTPTSPVIMETMLALKAKPDALAFSELPAALKAGKFDAQENPIPVIYNNKLYEVQKYLSITNHSYDGMPLVIRKDVWDKLSKDEQNAVKAAAKKAQDKNRSLVKEQTDSLVANLKKAGMTVSTPKLDAFKKATESVYEIYEAQYGADLIKKAKSFK